MGYAAGMMNLPAPASPPAPPTFTPVPNRQLTGWTAAKQKMFIETLTATGSVRLSTEAVGMSHTHVYKLRHMPGGESFARAWDEAVTIAATRVRDVLIDQAIHGVPERVLIGKDTVVERRRFNHRTMIWVLQHHMPDLYPGGSTTHRRSWEERRAQEQEDASERQAEELRARIQRKLDLVQWRELKDIAGDPAKRAAHELLYGPRDWTALKRPGSAEAEAEAHGLGGAPAG